MGIASMSGVQFFERLDNYKISLSVYIN